MNDFCRNGFETKADKDAESKDSVTVKGRKVNLYKCPHCEKTSKSMPGHITKMHQGKHLNGTIKGNAKRRRDSVTPLEYHEKIVQQEAKKIVDHLLDNVIIISDEECEETEAENEDLTLEEKVVAEYTNNCENCEFVAKADRKYRVIQSLRNHRESCCVNKMKREDKTVYCKNCDFVSKDGAI